MVLAPNILLLIVIFIVVILTLWSHERMRRRTQPMALRSFEALDVVRHALAHGAETGRALHISPGPGTIGGRGSTAETIAGLLLASRITGEAALTGTSVLASTGDATANLALRGTMRQAYQRAGLPQDFVPSNVLLLAQDDPMAYAAGVTTIYNRQKLEASVLVGGFDQEFLLASEIGGQRGVPQLAGTTVTAAQPLVYLASDKALIGEEIYAAEAFLTQSSIPVARLLVQDILRTVVIVALVVIVIVRAAGLPIGF